MSIMRSSKLAKIILTAITGLLLSFALSAVTSQPAHALTGSEFQAGRIIDDGIFYNPNTMTIAQIQEFLNAKVPVCDTWGTQMRGSITRAQHGTNNGSPPPYVCLKNHRQNTGTKPHEAGLCNGYNAVNQSAAEIIYHVSHSCGINPKALLVLLQKEQSLVTDDWPWPIQYRAATGYGCPDTAPCDAEYYGFFNQVYSAARVFKYYAKNPNSFNHIAGRNNFIRYNPSSTCGGSTVFILNQATAGLYNYTPYQPNAPALNNLYGTGDGCSAYGNRNFWRMFNDWFGSTTDNISISYGVRLTTPITTTPTDPIAGQATTVSFTVQNFTDQAVTYQSSLLQCRLNRTTNCDTGWGGATTLAAGEQRTFSISFTPAPGGIYTLTPYFLQSGTWYRYASSTTSAITLNVPDLRMTSPLTLTPSNPVAGEGAQARFHIHNFGTQPVSLDTSLVQCRRSETISCDSNYGGAVTLGPGQWIPVMYTLPAFQGGTHNLVPYFRQSNIWYRYNTYNSTLSSVPMTVTDVRLTSPITISPANPIPGQTVTATYTVQNFGSSNVDVNTSVLQCRFNTFTNCDPAYGSQHSIAAGAQRTYSVPLTIPRAGSYTLKPYFYSNHNWHHYAGNIANSIRVDVPAYVANMELVGPITTTPADPIPGQAFTANYTIKNAGDKQAIFQASILQCRYNTHTNCDPAVDSPITLEPDEQRSLSVNFPAVKAGTYTLVPYYSQNYAWYRYTSATANSLNVSVPAYVADMEIVGPITTSPAQPAAGQTVTVNYTIRNDGDKPAIFQTSILQCRWNTHTNCDPAVDSAITLAPGAQRAMSASFPAVKSGTYMFVPYYSQNNSWYRYTSATATSLRLDVP